MTTAFATVPQQHHQPGITCISLPEERVSYANFRQCRVPCPPPASPVVSTLLLMSYEMPTAHVHPQANLHRADRTPTVKVLALQGDYHSHDSDIFPMLEAYCKVMHTTCVSCRHAPSGRWPCSHVNDGWPIAPLCGMPYQP